MPAIQSVLCDATRITIQTAQRRVTVLASSIPQVMWASPSLIESWANAALAAGVTEYQVRVHVFSTAPLAWTVGTWNAGEPIPLMWWAVDGN